MEDIRAIVNRFPQRELQLRRRCRRDAAFRAICADYEEATAALRRWQGAGEAGEPKVAEYATFLGELEAEILAGLDQSVPAAGRTWSKPT